MRKRAPKQGSLGVDDQLVCPDGGNPFGSLLRVEHGTDEKAPEVNIKSLPGSRNISAENSLLPAVESSSCKGLNNSSSDLNGGLMSDNEGLNCEDMEFEPQTYVSFTEFGTSDDGQKYLDGVNPSGSITKKLNRPSTLSLNGKIEQYRASTNQQECRDPLAPDVHVVQCRRCSLAAPSPDRCCEICRQWMHSHCSPVKESSGAGPWRCFSCREWQ